MNPGLTLEEQVEFADLVEMRANHDMFMPHEKQDRLQELYGKIRDINNPHFLQGRFAGGIKGPDLKVYDTAHGYAFRDAVEEKPLPRPVTKLTDAERKEYEAMKLLLPMRYLSTTGERRMLDLLKMVSEELDAMQQTVSNTVPDQFVLMATSNILRAAGAQVINDRPNHDALSVWYLYSERARLKITNRTLIEMRFHDDLGWQQGAFDILSAALSALDIPEEEKASLKLAMAQRDFIRPDRFSVTLHILNRIACDILKLKEEAIANPYTIKNDPPKEEPIPFEQAVAEMVKQNKDSGLPEPFWYRPTVEILKAMGAEEYDRCFYDNGDPSPLGIWRHTSIRIDAKEDTSLTCLKDMHFHNDSSWQYKFYSIILTTINGSHPNYSCVRNIVFEFEMLTGPIEDHLIKKGFDIIHRIAVAINNPKQSEESANQEQPAKISPIEYAPTISPDIDPAAGTATILLAIEATYQNPTDAEDKFIYTDSVWTAKDKFRDGAKNYSMRVLTELFQNDATWTSEAVKTMTRHPILSQSTGDEIVAAAQLWHKYVDALKAESFTKEFWAAVHLASFINLLKSRNNG